MYTYESFQNLLTGFDRSLDDGVIEEALWKFSAEAGYSVKSVEKYLVLGHTRFFRITFKDERDAVLFSTAFFPIFDEYPPLNLNTSSVSIEVD